MNINLYAPIGVTGYGNVAINLLKELAKTENICLTPIGSPRPETQNDANIVESCLARQSTVDYKATCVKIWHQFDLLTKPGNGKYFAYPFFELDTFNDQEKHHLAFPDELIVSSEWAKNILINNNIKQNISTVPLGVDPAIFSPIKRDSQLPNYVFLTIGKWEIRKSHDVIIECFNKAFNESDDVELWMITHNPFLNQEQENEWLMMIQQSKLKDKIKVFPRLATQENIAEIISYANCGIYISRAEGWNLELLETMAMNKPVIATNYSAHTEYCNTDNSYLVDIRSTEKAIDNKWFHGTGNWAKIDDIAKDQIIDYMKYVYANKVNTNQEGINTAQKFSWENSAKTLLRCISQ